MKLQNKGTEITVPLITLFNMGSNVNPGGLLLNQPAAPVMILRMKIATISVNAQM